MTSNPWRAARDISGLTQREVERRCAFGTHGWLSWVERGAAPTADQEERLRVVLGPVLLGQPAGRWEAKGDAA